MMFLFLMIIIYLIYTQTTTPTNTQRTYQEPRHSNTARETLDLRLARGDISVEEYKEVKQEL